MERNINPDLDEIKKPEDRILIYVLIVAVTALFSIAITLSNLSNNRRNVYEKDCKEMKTMYERRTDSLLEVISIEKDKNLKMILYEKDKYDSFLNVVFKRRK